MEEQALARAREPCVGTPAPRVSPTSSSLVYVAEAHVTDALNAAHSEAAHDGTLRNPISKWTIV
eukprot:COSAG02_NODE_1_length_108762_cov_456.708287_25_plen_64_part_00